MDTQIVHNHPVTELTISQDRPIDQHPAAAYLAGLAPSSRRPMKGALDTIAGLGGVPDCLAVDWSLVRFQHTNAIRAALAERYAPATANRMLSALRGTLKAAWLLGQMNAEDYHRAAAVQNVTGSTLPAGRELSAGEILALMNNCANDPSPAGVRDAAIIGLMYACGLRRAEVISLDLAHFDQETGGLVISGKRNKERTAYLTNGALDAVLDWLIVRGDQPGALVWPVRKGGSLTPRRLTTQSIYNMLAKRARLAGVNQFSPHDLRRSFVSHLLAAGADISIVAAMAGHSNVQTTSRYDRRPETAKMETAGLLFVPYQRRK